MLEIVHYIIIDLEELTLTTSDNVLKRGEIF